MARFRHGLGISGKLGLIMCTITGEQSFPLLSRMCLHADSGVHHHRIGNPLMSRCVILSR
eukprot:5349-Eustigmatos_ZCMA.PRE.1